MPLFDSLWTRITQTVSDQGASSWSWGERAKRDPSPGDILAHSRTLSLYSVTIRDWRILYKSSREVEVFSMKNPPKLLVRYMVRLIEDLLGDYHEGTMYISRLLYTVLTNTWTQQNLRYTYFMVVDCRVTNKSVTYLCRRIFSSRKRGYWEFRTGMNVILHVSTTCVGFVSISGQPGCVDRPWGSLHSEK